VASSPSRTLVSHVTLPPTLRPEAQKKYYVIFLYYFWVGWKVWKQMSPKYRTYKFEPSEPHPRPTPTPTPMTSGIKLTTCATKYSRRFHQTQTCEKVQQPNNLPLTSPNSLKLYPFVCLYRYIYPSQIEPWTSTMTLPRQITEIL
jgi:hypothetical protein